MSQRGSPVAVTVALPSIRQGQGFFSAGADPDENAYHKAMSEPTETFNQVERYERYMETVRARATSREFDGDYVVPREHYEMIIVRRHPADSPAIPEPGPRGRRHPGVPAGVPFTPAP